MLYLKKQILQITALAFVVVFSAGCKYELGPFISFLTEEDRISRSWKFDKVLHNKVLVTTGSYDSIAYVSSFIGFDKGGRFSFLASDLHAATKGLTLYDGNWSFQDDKKNIQLTYDNTARGQAKFQIFQLTQSNVSLRLDESGNITEYYLIPGTK